jgi:fucose 4-O-acetylase-like acetyltransferase
VAFSRHAIYTPFKHRSLRPNSFFLLWRIWHPSANLYHGAIGIHLAVFPAKTASCMAPHCLDGQNTLPILALHVLAMTVIKAVALFVFNIEIVFNFWSSLGLALLQILILVPVILVLNKHFPILIGRENQKKDLKMNPDKAN